MSLKSVEQQKLEERLEKLLKQMAEAGYIKENEITGLVEKLADTLIKAHDNNESAALALFTNPKEVKKIMLLAICASVEQNNKLNPQPQYTAIFNSLELAKAFFSKKPELEQEHIKRISDVMLALMPPGPDYKKLAKQLVEDKYAKQTDNPLDNQLQTELAKYEFTVELMKGYMQAFGVAPNGTPLLTPQQGNVMGVQDAVTQGANDAGFLKLSQNNPNTNSSIRTQMELRAESLGEDITRFCADIMRAEPPRPTPE